MKHAVIILHLHRRVLMRVRMCWYLGYGCSWIPLALLDVPSLNFSNLGSKLSLTEICWYSGVYDSDSDGTSSFSDLVTGDCGEVTSELLKEWPRSKRVTYVTGLTSKRTLHVISGCTVEDEVMMWCVHRTEMKRERRQDSAGSLVRTDLSVMPLYFTWHLFWFLDPFSCLTWGGDCFRVHLVFIMVILGPIMHTTWSSRNIDINSPATRWLPFCILTGSNYQLCFHEIVL
jgi:hypothetical protein